MTQAINNNHCENEIKYRCPHTHYKRFTGVIFGPKAGYRSLPSLPFLLCTTSPHFPRSILSLPFHFMLQSRPCKSNQRYWRCRELPWGVCMEESQWKLNFVNFVTFARTAGEIWHKLQISFFLLIVLESEGHISRQVGITRITPYPRKWRPCKLCT